MPSLNQRLATLLIPLFFTVVCSRSAGGSSSTSESPASGAGGSGTSTSVSWAKSSATAAGNIAFKATATDSSGNVYAVGYQTGTTSVSYGNGQSAQAPNTSENALIAKFNSDGTTAWVRTVQAATSSGGTTFAGVTVDTSGNAYAVGYRSGNGNHDFGNSVIVSSTNASNSVLVVKYSSAGTAQWAKTVGGTSISDSEFYAVTADNSGNIYATGYYLLFGAASYDFGNGTTALNTGFSGSFNSVIVKYDASNGTTLAAKGIVSATNRSKFWAVTYDSNSGKIFAAGTQRDTGTFVYAGSPNVNVTACATNCDETNAVVVRYSTALNAEAGSTIVSSSSQFGISEFFGITADSSGGVYVVGRMQGTRTYGFGNSQTAAGSSTNYNPVIAKYDTGLSAQWVKTVSGTGLGAAAFSAVALRAGNVFAAGNQATTATYTYGTQSLTGQAVAENAILLRYDSSGNVTAAKTSSAGATGTALSGMATDSSGNVVAVGYQKDNVPVTYLPGLTITGATAGGSALNPVVVRYLGGAF